MSHSYQILPASVLLRLRRVVVLVLIGCFCLTSLSHGQHVAAKAPPHATTLVSTGVFSTPDLTEDPIDTLGPGTELELTGGAAQGFLGVVYGEGEAWIPSTNLTTGVRPGVETAMATVDTSVTDAPMRDSGIVTYVPEGESVILTGAAVDGYYAASYNGAGGWISGRDIAR